jgi:hypothetical protein
LKRAALLLLLILDVWNFAQWVVISACMTLKSNAAFLLLLLFDK